MSLARREADLSLWPARPMGNELIARKVSEIPYAVFASTDYIERMGKPDFAAGAPGHDVILRGEADHSYPEMMWMTSLTGHANIALRTGNTDLMLAATIAGVGIAALPEMLASERGLTRLPVAGRTARRELWLAVHHDTRRTPRISAFMDALVKGLRDTTEPPRMAKAS